VAVYYCQQYYS
nr:immunoglobulin light chain junction region [Homo sapiens]